MAAYVLLLTMPDDSTVYKEVIVLHAVQPTSSAQYG